MPAQGRAARRDACVRMRPRNATRGGSIRGVAVHRDGAGGGRRPGERHQSFAVQHDPRDVAVGAVLRILEAEAAFPSQPSVLVAAQAQPGGMHGVVDQLHAGRAAGVAADAVN